MTVARRASWTTLGVGLIVLVLLGGCSTSLVSGRVRRCPELEFTEEQVKVGEAGNLAVLTKREWKCSST